jgi:hypothetical protein
MELNNNDKMHMLELMVNGVMIKYAFDNPEKLNSYLNYVYDVATIKNMEVNFTKYNVNHVDMNR